MATLLQLVQHASEAFEGSDLYYGHGTDNAWDEACALVIDSLGLSHDLTETDAQQPVTADKADLIKARVERRIKDKTPVPYLTHKAWFYGLPFYVDESVLIPRSPIAEWLDRGFEPWLSREDTHAVLDLCTGSGCIAIAAAMAFDQAHVVGSDISEQALVIAKKNVTNLDVATHVEILSSDVFDQLHGRQFDLIISNPPYVGDGEMAALPAEYNHEPDMALRAEQNGLAIVDRILKQAANYLTDRGILVVEVGNSEAALVDKYPEVPFVWLDFENGGHGVFLLTKADLAHVSQ